MLHACNHSYEKLLGYFDISSDYCTIAILLDPRFKLDFYVDDAKTSTEISNQQNEAWIQLRRVLDAYYPVSESTSAQEHYSFTDVKRIFKKLKTAVADDEIRSYLKEYPRCGPDVNPINWWKEHSVCFPRLSKLARDFLSVPGSSASSERAFSGGRP